jgi:hypothetical protein
LAWEKKGEKEKALKEFRKVLKLNPGNKMVEEKIKELEKGGQTPTEKEGGESKK